MDFPDNMAMWSPSAIRRKGMIMGIIATLFTWVLRILVPVVIDQEFAESLAWIEEEAEWADYSTEAFFEYAAEFDAIFNSLSVSSKITPKGIRVTVKRPNGKIARSSLVKAA